METILEIHEKRNQLALNKILYGIEKFKKNLHPKHKAIFSSLAKIQQPHTLFITCCDSRIDPNLITSTQPGELFIVRNIGNIIPPFGMDSTPAEGAAIEYALGILQVKQIIICAHSECGAIAQVLSGNLLSQENKNKYPSVTKWLFMLENLGHHFSREITSEEAAKLNACLQLTHLRTYPIVQEKINSNKLKIQAFYYDIGKADLEMWDETLGKFKTIGEHTPPIIFGENQIRGLRWFTTEITDSR